MWGYVVRRLLQGVVLVFVVIVLNFFLFHLAPGNPVTYLIGDTAASPQYIAEVSQSFGLDKPLYVQLGIYVWMVIHGNLGFSYYYNAPVLSLIEASAPATFLLILLALFFSTSVGILLGVFAANKPYSKRDSVLTVFTLVGYSIPTFWLGQLLLLVFGVKLGWFPVLGMTSIFGDTTGLGYVSDVAYHSVLPVLTLGLSFLAINARLTRAKMIEVLGQDYIVTARAKGLRARNVLFGHAFRNAVLPLVTIIGINISSLLAGTVIVETVFTWPGLGQLLYQGLLARDYPLLLGLFLVFSIIVILVTLATDIVYAILDPRIRYK